jgi:hypothetical protein
MSVHWGFYCKDCNVDSKRWFEDPRELRQIHERAGENFQKVWGDMPLRLPTMEVEPLFFLAQHYGHELWVQCELAQLKLQESSEPESDDEDEEPSSPRVSSESTPAISLAAVEY